MQRGDPEGAAESIGKDLDKAGVGFLKETISNKIIKYREYYAAETTVEVVNANVHLILSRENKDTPHAGCWDGLTTKASRTYQGFGEHTQMVNPGAVGKNAEIIREILGGGPPNLKRRK
jgi:thioesterase domain-containing protein